MKKIRIQSLTKTDIVKGDRFSLDGLGNLYIYRYERNTLETFAILPVGRWNAVWFVDAEDSE